MFYYIYMLYIFSFLSFSFFFNDTATTEIYTLSLHDALPIWPQRLALGRRDPRRAGEAERRHPVEDQVAAGQGDPPGRRLEPLRAGDGAGQRGRLCQRQPPDRPGEVVLGRGGDPVDPVAEVDPVQVGGQDLVLAQPSRQLDRVKGLDQLAMQADPVAGDHVLDVLLGEVAAALADVAGEQVGDRRPEDPAQVEGAVGVEAGVRADGRCRPGPERPPSPPARWAPPRPGRHRSGPGRSPTPPKAGGAKVGGHSCRAWSGVRRRLGRQGECKGAAGAGDALGPDASAMRLDQFLADGEAEPAAAAGPGPGRVQPEEAVEDLGEVLWADPWAGVGHRQSALSGLVPDPDPDRAAGAGVLDRVVDQVGDDLSEAGLVD